jgi:hypothetical protein
MLETVTGAANRRGQRQILLADLLLEGRDRNPDFRVTGDMVHLAPAGQLAVAMGMLKGLGEERAVAYLREKYTPALWGKPKDPLTG